MTERPWLTVVMPIHDGAAWLRATLDSVVAADPEGIEFIAIDSSASDESANILASYAGRIDLVVHRRPDLLAWTVKTNLGVNLARADHVAMLHQDDVWAPDRAMRVRQWIEGDPDAVLHLGPTTIIDATGGSLGQWRCPLPTGSVARDLLLERLLVQNFVSVPSPIVRREAWLAVGGMDEALWYTGDWDLWLKLAQAGPVVHHTAVTTGFRVHDGSQTVTGSRKRREFEAQMSIVLERHIGALPARSLRKVGAPARASIRVNSALADAMGGNTGAILRAMAALLRLSPAGLWRYLHCSRLLDRAIPRLRAKLMGAM